MEISAHFREFCTREAVPAGGAVVSEAAERTMLEDIDGPLKSFLALRYFDSMC